MSRMCELSGKGPMVGNNVSHANNKTKRVFRPNLVQVSLISDATGQSYRLRVCAHALRTVEHRGGLDNYLLKARNEELSQRVRLIKRNVQKALAKETIPAA